MRNYLIINKHSPFSNYNGQEGIELALALASLEQQVSILFIQDGCWQLQKNCTANAHFRKDFLSNLKAWQLTGITEVYANKHDCNLRNINKKDCSIEVKMLDHKQQQQLINSAEIVFNVG